MHRAVVIARSRQSLRELIFKAIAVDGCRRSGWGRSLPRGFLCSGRGRPSAPVRLPPVTEVLPRGDANGFANDGHGVLWTDLDDAAVRQQVKGRAWTTVDTVNLAMDKTVDRDDDCGCCRCWWLGRSLIRGACSCGSC
jgi:hypothetical protein